MTVIFCLSYLSLSQTIYLIEKYGENNVMIITSNRNIERFFSQIYNDNIVFFVNNGSFLLPKNLLQFLIFPLRIVEIFIKKQKYWKTIRKIKESDVYFFFNSAAFFHAWLLSKMSKKNTLFYEEDLKLDSFELAQTAAAKLNTCFIRKIYAEQVIPLDQKTGITYKMSPQFLEKNNVNFISIDYDFDTISHIISSKTKFPKGEILYLPPLLSESNIGVEEYIDFVNVFITECQNQGINLHLKRHPRSKEKYSKEEQLFEAPVYYPVNFLVDYKMIISFNTSALFERANRGDVSISLVKILMKDNVDLMKSTISYLSDNLEKGKKILFPENISELMKYILDFMKIDD